MTNPSPPLLEQSPLGSPPLGWNDAQQNCTRTTITEEDAKIVLSSYRLSAPLQQIFWHSQHRLTESCLIRLHNGKILFLKRHNAQIHSPSGLSAEHHFMMFLAEQGLPVVPPCRTWQGRSLVWHGDGLYTLFPALNGPPFHGQDLYRDVPSWHPYHSVDHAYEAGAMLARLHLTSASYTSPSRDDLLLSSCQILLEENFPAALAHWLQHWASRWSILSQFSAGTEKFQRVIKALAPWHQKLFPMLHNIKPCWGHGDWHGSNLAWHENKEERDKPCQIFDFGMSNLTSAPFDLAIAIERSFISWLTPHTPQPVHYDQLEGFLQGYHNIRPISPQECALIAGFLPLCHIEFALSEIPYYHTLLNQPESVNIAYESYLIGHANWFYSPEGEILLQKLHHWRPA